MIPPPPASSPIHRPRDRGSWTLPGPAPVTPGPYGLDSHAGCRTRDVARPAPGYGRVLDSHADAGCRTRDAARASGRSCSWAYGVGRGTALVTASNGRNLRGRLRRPVRVDGLQRRPPGSSACRMLGQRSRLVRAIPRARSTDNSPSGPCRRGSSSQRQSPSPDFEVPQAPLRAGVTRRQACLVHAACLCVTVASRSSAGRHVLAGSQTRARMGQHQPETFRECTEGKADNSQKIHPQLTTEVI